VNQHCRKCNNYEVLFAINRRQPFLFDTGHRNPDHFCICICRKTYWVSYPFYEWCSSAVEQVVIGVRMPCIQQHSDELILHQLNNISYYGIMRYRNHIDVKIKCYWSCARQIMSVSCTVANLWLVCMCPFHLYHNSRDATQVSWYQFVLVKISAWL
jgi:hypothetical protein